MAHMREGHISRPWGLSGEPCPKDPRYLYMIKCRASMGNTRDRTKDIGI